MRKLIFTLALISVFYIDSKGQNCFEPTASADLDINDVRTKIMNGGDMWWDISSGLRSYEVPLGSGKHANLAGSIWLGGLDPGGNLHLAAQTYRQSGNDFWPGPINQNGATTPITCSVYDRIWKINKSEIIAHISNPLNATVDINSWPGYNEVAPFIDLDQNGFYEPGNGEYPKINGDQALFWVFNDVGNTHTETNARKIGVEVQAMAFAFSTNDILDRTTFYQYKFINKSDTFYHDFYFAFWNDSDMGCLGGMTGSDSSRKAVISYHFMGIDGPNNNLCYSSVSVLNSLFFLQAPLQNGVPAEYKSGCYANDATVFGNPSSAEHFYGYMKGTWKDQTPWGYNHYFPGNPCDTNQLSMTYPILVGAKDWRTIQTFGPMTFAPGECKTMLLGVTTIFNGQSPNLCFDPMYNAIDSIKNLTANIIDFNVFSCSGTANAISNNQNLAQSINIFPNPAHEFYIKGSAAHKNFNVVDVFGKHIPFKIETFGDYYKISFHEQESGIYFLLDQSTGLNYKLVKI
jgi:hypothetical protein